MYRNTRFGELLKGFPKKGFQRCVDRYEGDKHSKGFGCWDQLVAMIFAQLSSNRSLRELEVSYNSQSAHHYHVGSGPIRRSTLSDANRKRKAEVYEAFCTELLKVVHGKVRREVKDLLYLLDSTSICLKGRGYEWTVGQSQPQIPGLKLHLLYAPEVGLPCMAKVGKSNENDIEFGRRVAVEAGATYVFDKGYCDYNWWYRLDQAGAWFVTRFKKNAGLKVIKTNRVAASARGVILSDEWVQFKNKHPGGGRINRYLKPLRRIVVYRADKETPLVIATNDGHRSALEIAELYKRRWGIELWFKWLKQRLKIKQFLGRSSNAVKIQIFTALITYLLVYRYRQLSDTTQSFYLWLAELKATLFQRPLLDYHVLKRRRRLKSAMENRQVPLPI